MNMMKLYSTDTVKGGQIRYLIFEIFIIYEKSNNFQNDKKLKFKTLQPLHPYQMKAKDQGNTLSKVKD